MSQHDVWSAVLDASAAADPSGPRKLLSIVMPARNEEEMLEEAYGEVTQVMAGLPYDYEVLLIDNHSTDRTPEIAARICTRDDHWRYIKFSRDFTAEISLAAGLYYSRGDAVIFLFSDLQDPPDKIPEMIAKWEQGYEVVYGVHTRRPGDPKWRNFCVAVFYRLINMLSDVRLPRHAGDFRLLSRRVVDVLNHMDERERYLRGMIHWVGFKRVSFDYERRPRIKGSSKGPLLHIIGFALTAMTSFSIKPLRAFSLFGIGVLCFTLALAAFYVVSFLAWGTIAPGVTTTYVLLLMNLGVMSLGFGVLGEYIGRIFAETKRRPLWIVEHTINLGLPQSEHPAAEVASCLGGV